MAEQLIRRAKTYVLSETNSTGWVLLLEYS
jgi:hypothetical protein